VYLSFYRFIANGWLITDARITMAFTHFSNRPVTLSGVGIPVKGFPLILQQMAKRVRCSQTYPYSIPKLTIRGWIDQVVPIADFHPGPSAILENVRKQLDKYAINITLTERDAPFSGA
jgi:hypothetical protein